MSVIQIEKLNHYYGKGALRRHILQDLDLVIPAGQIVILTGPSGCGKTTLLTLVGALRGVQEGSLKVLGQELRGADRWRQQALRRQLGFIFQAHNLLMFLTARQNVRMGLELHARWQSREADRRAQEMLEQVGLGEHADKLPDQLSGGQRQRVAIARALAAEPRLVLADEPTAALDKQSGREVVDLLQRLAREHGTTVLLVTHDPRILDVADRLVAMEDGCLF